jgi:hypothetical protein
MEFQAHTLSSLFDQLGLDAQNKSIDNFTVNRTIARNVELHEATFWNASQAPFLKQVKDEDADWAGIIDQLDVMLR